MRVERDKALAAHLNHGRQIGGLQNDLSWVAAPGVKVQPFCPSTAQRNRTMGAFSLWHWLILLAVLAVPVLVVTAVVLLVLVRRGKSKAG